jgi:hypothetical protein
MNSNRARATGRASLRAKARTAVKSRKPVHLDEQTGMVDVQVLDVLAQVESLLRDVHEIQRLLLRVRGLPEHATAPQRRVAAATVCKRTLRMLDNSDALPNLLRELLRTSESLADDAS